MVLSIPTFLRHLSPVCRIDSPRHRGKALPLASAVDSARSPAIASTPSMSPPAALEREATIVLGQRQQSMQGHSLPQVASTDLTTFSLHIDVHSTWSEWSATEAGLTKIEVEAADGSPVDAAAISILVCGRVDSVARDRLLVGSGRTTDPADMWTSMWIETVVVRAALSF